ncbi:MAG TPA: DUF1232 domain-containing protein [Baekduia sp.]|nr:DUF1232 domain-containing protein [Baekduia sp.]
MSTVGLVIAGCSVALALYAGLVIALIVAGHRTDARALAGFVPDCVVLFGRLLRDSRVSPARKLLLGALVLYLVMPLDLIPDFIPVVGQLDDAIVVAIALRLFLRGSGGELLTEHWPGPQRSGRMLLRLVGNTGTDPA